MNGREILAYAFSGNTVAEFLVFAGTLLIGLISEIFASPTQALLLQRAAPKPQAAASGGLSYFKETGLK